MATCMGSLAPAPMVVSSLCPMPGCPSSPAVNVDSLTGPVGHLEGDHCWASSADLKGTFLKWTVDLVMVLPSSLSATTQVPFWYFTCSGSVSCGVEALWTACLWTNTESPIWMLEVLTYLLSSAHDENPNTCWNHWSPALCTGVYCRCLRTQVCPVRWRFCPALVSPLWHW